MELTRVDPTTVQIGKLDALLVELLRRVSTAADPSGSEAARTRLFSAPTHDENEAELLEDWQDVVMPELETLFQSALDVVERDLKTLRVNQKNGEGQLRLPMDHLEKWIHALNQARLALAARHDFSEKDLDRIFPLTGDSRALALLQIRFYGLLQELFLRELEDE